MTAFRYRAARGDGEVLHGTVDAGSAAAALQLVEGRGLFPIEVEQAPPTAARRPAGGAELATTLAGLAALLDAGLPMDRALSAVEETSSPRVQLLLARALERVREGATLSAALDASGEMPALVLGYLKAGEKSGRLGGALERAAAQLERDAETVAKVRAALTYPAFLTVAGTISVIAIVGFVVPRFATLLGTEGHALPASTRLLVAASNTVGQWAIPALVAGMLVAVATLRALATSDGQLALHRWLLALPLVGTFRLRIATARVCGTLSSLTDAAVPLLAALELARDAAGDRAVGARIAEAREDVNRGERLAVALRRHKALSPVALRLVAFGEQSGRLAVFLDHAARLEAAATQRTIQRAVTMLEPALILGFGGIVAFVAAALLQAVYSVRPGL